MIIINNEVILIIFDVDGNIWFSFRDTLNCLGYSDLDHTINDMDISDDNKIYYY